MLSNGKICEKIEELFPEKGECGIDMSVSFDKKNKAYVLSYKENNLSKKTFLEIDDASLCIEKDRCIGLSFQVNQLR